MSTVTPPKVLTIAGSDPSGGAGIEADLKVITTHGCYGMTTITALTAQNTRGVRDIHVVPPSFVRSSLEAVLDDIKPDVIKIGMLAARETIEVVMNVLEAGSEKYDLVLDPVMVSTSGSHLLKEDAVSVLIERVLPKTFMLTPNTPEAALLLKSTGTEPPEIKSVEDLIFLAKRIRQLGPDTVLIKGGHCPMDKHGNLADKESDMVKVVNVFYDGEVSLIETPYISSTNTHGTGCSLASAIASNLAKGLSPVDSIRAGCNYVSAGIESAPKLGSGKGPINHLHSNQQVAFPSGKFIDYLIGHPTIQANWDAYTRHEFVQQLGAGTLDLEVFKFYLIQDYLFLIQFARANALAAYKSHDMSTIAESAAFVGHIQIEMQLHLNYCSTFGISKSQIESAAESSACTAYTRYVLDIGNSMDFLALQVAMAPCAVGYAVIARQLRDDPTTKREGNVYWKWIENYTSEEYVGSVDAMRGMIERAVEGMGSGQVERLEEIFLKATRLEEAFWEDALRSQG
ncbi:phosphomethylpyrimidine kinase [Ascodesmis nigricans]|uniref:Phosphomethylpyrimidine kinase n=1 Tax=Ascodesmis nigricans TaxID=341454 RepID=A0A4S2N3Z5_9PEZI|nr:phosphomethylpyrimidine kinase [Ascodesmis nigricans]